MAGHVLVSRGGGGCGRTTISSKTMDSMKETVVHDGSRQFRFPHPRRSLLFAIVFFLGSHSVWALPIFARRYQTSCTTCHAIIPKLNPFGMAFRNNGYRIPGNDE